MEFYPSKCIEDAVHAMATLPGIGKKTALRLVLFLLKAPQAHTQKLTDALRTLRATIRYCSQCHNIADDTRCRLCTDPKRNQALLCVVENIQDVLAIENTGQYKGRYHVLGGVISPLEGIGPEKLTIDSLVSRVQDPQIKEVIFALRATIEGDTTLFYIKKQLQESAVRVSTIARGVAVGGELEYTDALTLGRSIAGRVVYA